MNPKILTICLLGALLFYTAAAYTAPPDDIATQRSCRHCGMDRKAYGYSRMLITYADGSSSGVCSLNCAVTEMSAKKGRPLRSILVADRNSRELLPAEQAFWTLGGTKKGVMTHRPKWAFTTKAAADEFVARYGGTVVSWPAALAAAEKDAGP